GGPAVEGELLEEVVVEPGARGDAHPAGPVEGEAYADPGLGGRAKMPCPASSGCGDRRRPVECPRERLEEQVVVLAIPDAEAHRARQGPDDDARAEQGGRDPLGFRERNVPK